VDTALASLLGAVIGGGIASSSSLGLERIQARREREAADRRDRREARRAARLLAEELEAGRRLLARAQENGWYTWEPPKRLLPAAAWTEYRSDFATQATDEEWRTVAAAFGQFDRLNWHLIDRIELEGWIGEGREDPMEPRRLGSDAKVEDALGEIDAALALLQRLMASDT
jgi:hypothetical protein